MRYFSSSFLYSSLVILSILLFSCEDELDGNVTVLTEDVFFVGSDKVRVIGRVISTSNFQITDHGFQVSQDADFTSPVSVSLGDRNLPGRFIAEVGQLSIGTEYFVRSYMETEFGSFTGNVIQIETLLPRLFDFTPKYALPGEVMQITGVNFTNDTRVFFGDIEAQITDISFESIITLNIPSIGSQTIVPIRVETPDLTLTGEESFEYISGTYNSITNFPINLRISEGISLADDDFVAFGLGIDQLEGQAYLSFWKFDLGTENWSQIPFSGDPHLGGFSGGNYFGGGVRGAAFRDALLLPQAQNASFWQFDGNDFTLISTIPYPSYNSIGFEMDGYFYVVGGSDDRIQNQFFRYSILEAQWELLQDSPYALRTGMPTFSYGTKQYFVDAERRLISYNVSNQTWLEEANYPGSNTLGGGVASVINDRAFVGFYNRSNEVWELDLNSFEWKIKRVFTGNLFADNLVMTSFNNSIYNVRSITSGATNAGAVEVWIFNPDGF